jgi:hypothetical protein
MQSVVAYGGTSFGTFGFVVMAASNHSDRPPSTMVFVLALVVAGAFVHALRKSRRNSAS